MKEKTVVICSFMQKHRSIPSRPPLLFSLITASYRQHTENRNLILSTGLKQDRNMDPAIITHATDLFDIASLRIPTISFPNSMECLCTLTPIRMTKEDELEMKDSLTTSLSLCKMRFN